ncbi:MAG: CpsD/CapB family tyrosine-protein kinase [Nitrospirae bacterium]|nr:CpsD/CapB family tyrosine-protein kinase [Nitrospirota bacterium]MBF0540491.1 CpsD/CapB family tyrosine-protein kinase [Nitrospirota bacterium]
MSEQGILSNEIKKLIKKNLNELRLIEENLISAAYDKKIKTIYVTSCSSKEGKTTAAVSLSYALADHSKVLLVDGNFRVPVLHKIFSLNKTPGLLDIFRDNEGHTLIPMSTEFEKLKVLPNGEPLAKTFNIFRNKTFIEIYNLWLDLFDYVVFDGDSILDSIDISDVVRYFDGIILVVECERTTCSALQDAKAKVERGGGNILGVVLNKRRYYIPKIFRRFL